MQIKTTQKFAKTMQTQLKKIDKFKNYKITLEKLTQNQFEYYVDCYSLHGFEDYDFTTGKFKVIKIVYPLDYYACDKYLTTSDLIQIYNKSDKTFEGYIKAFCDFVEV